jgi:hypothetical protein
LLDSAKALPSGYNCYIKKKNTSCDHFFAKSVHQLLFTTMSNKRRKTTTSTDIADTNSLHITDLPDGLLVGISSYLAKPSVALFAIAMATTNSQEQTQTTKAIISAIKWNVLDFSVIEKSLASKLSDDHIDKILRSIDAVNNLHILKLAGCVNITGSGLDMLRSSIAIQQIDLSLVGKHEAPFIEPEPLLSESIVISILDDIISRGSILKQLEFPKKWRNIESTQFDQFLLRYNQYLIQQRYRCSKCDRVCVETGRNEWIGLRRDEWHGIQNYSCFACLNHFCYDENCVDENQDCYVQGCKKCEKVYCKLCISIKKCSDCRRYACTECKEMKACEGEDCEKTFCEGCSTDYVCSFCGEMKCRSCDHLISYCSSCNIVACAECPEQYGWGKNDKCDCGDTLGGYL